MKPFVVFTQPFCEATWLGALLTYKDYVALVDMSLALRSVNDLDMLLARPRVGYVDTNLALLWPEVIDRTRDARFVVVRRPVEEIVKQGEKLGMEGQEDGLRRLDLALNEIEGLNGVLSLCYADLAKPSGLKRLFEFCLPYKWDPEWYSFVAQMRSSERVPNNAILAQQNLDGISNTFGHAVVYYDMRLREAQHAD